MHDAKYFRFSVFLKVTLGMEQPTLLNPSALIHSCKDVNEKFEILGYSTLELLGLV